MNKVLCFLLVLGALGTGWGQSVQEAPVAEVVTEHCDFLIQYDPAASVPLSIVLRDEDRRRNYRTNEVRLVAAETARLALPPGTPFGGEGDPVWVLPQSQDPNLLYLGFSAERIPSGVFSRPFNFRLVSVEGPGHFFAWQATEFGSLSVRMNTRDGIGEDDKTTPIIGSHEHFNWGFTSNGLYRVTFQVDGRRVGESTNLVSEPSTFDFHVLPLPAAPPHLEAVGVRPDGGFLLNLHGVAGRSYRLESSEDLVRWTEAQIIKMSMPIERVTVNAPAGTQFFRARQL